MPIRATLGMLLAFLASSSTAGKGCSAEGQVSEQGRSPAFGESPWDLRLEESGGRTLVLTLRNRSSRTQTYLYESKLQPAILELSPREGPPIEPMDSRELAKYDNTLYRSHYRELKPGASIVLIREAFDANPGGYALRWGVFRFSRLEAGRYRAQAVWTSAHDHWTGRDRKGGGVVPGIWKGAVASNRIELVLP